jgi:hypothetical protein
MQRKYFSISHNDKRVEIDTPYDDEIILLGEQLNRTYLNYGLRSKREAKEKNIVKQDANAKGYSKSSYVERNLVKSKKQYANAEIDMVSTYMNDESIIEQIEEKKLPTTFKGKDKKEIKKVLEEKRDERVALQAKIKELEGKRGLFLATQSTSDKKDLGTAIIQSIRKQASDNGFVFVK